MYIYLILAFRVTTIMLVLLISTLIISGKRPIGELPVFDFLTIIVIGAVTGADIAEPKVPHIHIIFAIIAMCLFQKIINTIYLKSYFFRKIITFPPTIIVQDGKMIYKNMKKVKYSADEVLMLLRENDVFDISQVKYGILEASGDISILKKGYAETVTKKDMDIKSMDAELKHTIIFDGKFQSENLKLLNFSEEDIIKIIKEHGYNDISEIFFASMDKSKNISISPYDFEGDNI
ncbi:DUF421 domain-containing protein [Oceanirhabdus sp. W0125-5]|uniref:DUF421 domain-containing protein n=1 Tax=Oceanirhabdus sp. W0125-5 TaxID=2999116 RepID=UPI0022F33E20|nr:DUF421 domain-containing protein [Oceanirhabdus sp. W0125-5]WBW97268.1 DUF421 domain-containing protein [Oceanirhabdus sp. W0125-5]